MSTGDTIALIGLIVTWFASLAGFSFAVFRACLSRIESNRKDMDSKVDDLHSRINGVQRDVVPRSDMLEHVRHIEKTLDQLNARMDNFLTRLATSQRANHAD